LKFIGGDGSSVIATIGLEIITSSVWINDVIFMGYNGGAIIVTSNSYIDISDSLFINNSALIQGN
jgi:hypothetical protein